MDKLSEYVGNPRAMLEHPLGGNTVLDWLFAAAVLVVAAVAVRFVGHLLIRRLDRVARRTETHVDDALVGALERTRWFFWTALAVLLASTTLELSDDTLTKLRTAVILAVLLQGGFWASGLIRFQTERYIRARSQDDPSRLTGVSMIGLAARLIAWAVLFLVALDNVGVNVTALVAGLGVGGIALALAVQNILGDLFASVSILLDKPFVVGEFIIVDEYLGNVEKVGIKTTHVRSLNGELLVFSNNDLLQSRIRNYQRMAERRSLFRFAIAYETPYDKVERVPEMIREIIDELDGTRFDRAHFKEFGDYALVFEVAYYLTRPDYAFFMDVQQQVNLAIIRRLQEAGIPMAYPAQNVYVHTGGGPGIQRSG